MSLRTRASLANRRSPVSWLSPAVSFALLLSACSSVASPSSGSSLPTARLSASSSGLCQAILALPDMAVTERAFINVAHESLHALAADPRLDRSAAALVLETMARVESDFRASTASPTLAVDLAALRTSTDAALQALGEEVPGCAA
ncbi:MAG: hypothetical protein QOJ75_2252 [Chloroflexota bacterium]|nr:hypothetical protein [Chloroflexota bacterium]